MNLDDLIKAVEAGTFLMDVLPWPHEGTAYRAFSGSLDEAKAVHDALLPGWKVRIDTGLKHRTWVLGDNGVKIDAYADNPARAWLLAILKAKQAERRG